MVWQARQLCAGVRIQKMPHNPNPPGVVRPGSGSDVLLRFLRCNPRRWFLHSELVLSLGRSKGEVDWALQYLAQLRLISSAVVELPGRKPVMRYALRDTPDRVANDG